MPEIQDEFSPRERERLVKLIDISIESGRSATNMIADFISPGIRKLMEEDQELLVRLASFIAP
jgi:hypothetical protein